MSGGPAAPPGFWRALLRLVLGRSLRGEAIRGDLDEEFRERADRATPREARSWYRRQVVRIALRYELPRRLGWAARPSRASSGREPSASRLELLARDVRIAVRRLVATPAITVAAVVVMAVGTGATTAAFSVLDAVLLRPLPFPDADRLVQVGETNAAAMANGLAPDRTNYLNYLEYRASSETFESMAFIYPWMDRDPATVGGDRERPELVEAASISPSFFDVTGHGLLMGRSFDETEVAESTTWQECRSCWRYTDVVIISHDLWRRRFGGDPDILGSTIEFDAGRSVVVGVTAPGFRPPPVSINGETQELDPDVYVPLFYPAYDQPRNYRQVVVLGRLLPEVDLDVARAELNRIVAGIEEQYPDALDGARVDVSTLQSLVERRYGAGLYAVLGIATLVLLIACADVANLLFARGARRRTEMAIRRSIGGGRGHLIQLLLVESLLLASVGGALGLLLAVGGTDVLLGMAPEGLLRASEAGVNLRLLGFAMALAVTTGVVTGLLPALRSTDVDLGPVLKGGAPGGTRRSWEPARILIAGQVALTLVLLAAGGVLSRSFLSLRGTEPGFEPENVVILSTIRGEHHWMTGLRLGDHEKRSRVWSVRMRILDNVRRVPGVVAAEMGPTPRATGVVWRTRLMLEDPGDRRPTEEEMVRAQLHYVSPGYFDAMGIPIVRGEGLPEWTGDGDWSRYWWATSCGESDPGICKAVVSRSFAESTWPGEDPIGKTVGLYGCCWTVSGVVPDARFDGLDVLTGAEDVDPGHQVYVAWPENDVVVRTAGDPGSMIPALRDAVLDADPQTVVTATTMEARMADALSRPRFYMLVATGFGILALAMAMVGLYGVIAHSVSRRTREIGIRIALGAAHDRVRRLVLRQALAPVAVGLVVGLVGAFLVRDVLDRFLFGASPTHPGIVGAVAGLLVLSAVLASYLPARRASSVEPVQALRTE